MEQYITVEEEQKAFASVMVNYDDCLELPHFRRGSPSMGVYESRYPDGVHEVWNPDGTLCQRINYQGGFREGECRLLYPSRHIYSVYHRGELQLYREYALASK
jgi:antitoxin component YwqK of YwqJK toxin-antitoxin module